MKKEKIFSGFKNASVIAGLAFALHSCGEKPLTETQTQVVQHKMDSALNVHPEYRTATSMLELCEWRSEEFKTANKEMVTFYSVEYIKHNIDDSDLRRFMFNAMLKNKTISWSDEPADTDSLSGNNNIKMMRQVRHNQKWFNDAMLYLMDKYDEAQLLKSDFFKVINNSRFKHNFKKNAEFIQEMNKYIKFASERQVIIRNELWNKYAKEVKKR